MKKITFVVCLLMIGPSNYAQKVLKGKVTNEAGEALFGAVVQEKGTNNGSVTDFDGNYTLKYSKDDALIAVSYVGYQTMEQKAEGKTELNFQLTANTILNAVEIVGTRKLNRSVTETAVPIDIVDISEVKNASNTTQLMQDAVPSLNYNKQSGSDGADHIDLATLRGLGPDQTLVLINGKRRHQTAFVALFGTRGRGNSGTDMSSIPVAAIERLEVLRDGASAQYGSDAIAGAINIVLKKNVNEFTGDLSFGGNYDNTYNTAFKPSLKQYEYSRKFDGNLLNFNANYGLGIGEKGFINVGINFRKKDKTFRQVLDTANLTKNDNALPLNPYRRANGDASMQSFSGFMNMEIPLGSANTTFYSFGGYTTNASDAFAFSRNFSMKPERFPTDANGNLIFVSDIMHYTSDSDVYYNPHIQTNITDASLCLGFKGKLANGWDWDVSNVTGKNKFHFYGDKTFNASLGASKTHFDDGGFSFLQSTTNAGLSKEISSVASGLNLAFGLENRIENYEIVAGEEASYKNYDTLKATGAQGFPGYQKSDEVKANRMVFGAYADAELDVTKQWLITGAVRFENYSDFGFTHNYKISSRYKVLDNFTLRGSASTGFRAPSLQQINFSSTFTTVQGALVSEVKIAPNYSSIAKAAGVPNLKQENSMNLGLGFTFSPIKNLSFTVDAYQVKVKDRVVLSGQFSKDDPTLDKALIDQMDKLNVSLAQFFVNAVNTTNKGIDLVVENKWVSEAQIIRISLAANLQKMTIDKINVPAKLNDTEDHRKTFLSDREQAFILASAPNSKLVFKIQYEKGIFSIGTRATYFGKVELLGYGEDGLGINPMVPTDDDPNVKVADRYIYNGKLVNDLFTSVKLGKWTTLTLGADNLLNIHPDFGAVKSAKWWAYYTETGGPWDAVQMGFSGRFLYAKLGFKF